VFYSSLALTQYRVVNPWLEKAGQILAEGNRKNNFLDLLSQKLKDYKRQEMIF
jgi:hypothetical protein